MSFRITKIITACIIHHTSAIQSSFRITKITTACIIHHPIIHHHPPYSLPFASRHPAISRIPQYPPSHNCRAASHHTTFVAHYTCRTTKAALPLSAHKVPRSAHNIPQSACHDQHPSSIPLQDSCSISCATKIDLAAKASPVNTSTSTLPYLRVTSKTVGRISMVLSICTGRR